MADYISGLVYDKNDDFMIGRKFSIPDQDIIIDLTGTKVGKRVIENLEEKFGEKIYLTCFNEYTISWAKFENDEIVLKGFLEVI